MNAGLDLVDYGLARTVLITALAEGLKSGNATFTLPQMQRGSQEEATQPPAIAHVLSSMDQVLNLCLLTLACVDAY